MRNRKGAKGVWDLRSQISDLRSQKYADGFKISRQPKGGIK